jgi:hypothetical protein
MQDDTKPPFSIFFPPHPRSPELQDVLDRIEPRKGRTLDALWKDAETHFAAVYFNAGAGNPDVPPYPATIQNVGGRARGIMLSCISEEWKAWHYKQGFESRPLAEQEEILRKMEEARSAPSPYDHLPEKAMVGGREVSNDELRAMVDAGMLPPNPALGLKPPPPDVDLSGPILKTNIIPFPGQGPVVGPN